MRRISAAKHKTIGRGFSSRNLVQRVNEKGSLCDLFRFPSNRTRGVNRERRGARCRSPRREGGRGGGVMMSSWVQLATERTTVQLVHTFTL